jgi:hypothetical protein
MEVLAIAQMSFSGQVSQLLLLFLCASERQIQFFCLIPENIPHLLMTLGIIVFSCS